MGTRCLGIAKVPFLNIERALCTVKSIDIARVYPEMPERLRQRSLSALRPPPPRPENTPESTPLTLTDTYVWIVERSLQLRSEFARFEVRGLVTDERA